jgi:hypothetical protein
MADADIEMALKTVDELIGSGSTVAAADKKPAAKKAPGYDVYASLKSASEGAPDSKVDSLERLLNKIGDAAPGKPELMSVTVHFVRPLGSVVAVQAARPPSKGAMKLLSKLAGKPALSTLKKEDAEKVSTFVMSKNGKLAKKSVKVAKKAKIEKPKADKPKKPSAQKKDETPQARIEANLKKLQKKQKDKAV